MSDRPELDHAALQSRLSEYLDGTLEPSRVAGAELHLAACADCRQVLEQLRSVRGHAAALPGIAPPESVWHEIERRLDAEAAAPAPIVRLGAERRRREWRWSFSLPQLAAAAAAVIVLSVAGTWFALERGGRGAAPAGTTTLAARTPALEPAAPAGSTAALSAPLDTTPAPRAPGAASRTPFGTTAVAAGSRAERYDTAIADLEQVLQRHRKQLDPKTVTVVERNLALIDEAIAEARRALAADPASPYLNLHLADTMKRKVELLRRVTAAFES